MYKFKFADIGEGLHEGVVVKIYKNIGEKINEGEPLFLVETDKVTSDITSPVDGVINEILIKINDKIHVGDVVFHIEDDLKNSKKTNNDPEPKISDPKTTNQNLKENTEEDIKEKESSASVVGTIEVSNKILNYSSFNKNSIKNNNNIPNLTQKNNKNIDINQKTILKQDNIFTTPFARAFAKAQNVNLKNIKGSGISGRILVKDIEDYIKQNNAKPEFIINQENDLMKKENKIIPISSIRNAISKAMKLSWNNVAYTNLVNEVNVSKLWNERKLILNSVFAKTNIKLTFTAFFVKALVIALKEFPILNAKYDEPNHQIIQYVQINLGLAVDTPKGLMVPVIKNINNKTILEIAKEIEIIASKAKNNKLTIKDMSEGTFTLTNYGTTGAHFGVPVINLGEMAIVGIGKIVDAVLVDEKDNFYKAKIMNLTCAADHRWVDGAEIGRFISRIKELLENPLMLGVM